MQNHRFPMAHERSSDRGFTLIELLIVISIIGLLAAVLLPNIFGMSKGAKITATKTTMLRLSVACKTFVQKHGYYPPDNLKWPEPEKKTAWKPDNGQNTGIESLVCFLSQSRSDGEDLSDLGEARFCNTDEDEHGVELPLLHRKDRVEICDEWKTPFAYFDKFRMDKQQPVVLQEGESQMVKAMKRPDGRYRGEGAYQILSAGPDGKFGTDDDIAWPDN